MPGVCQPRSALESAQSAPCRQVARRSGSAIRPWFVWEVWGVRSVWGAWEVWGYYLKPDEY